MELPEYGSHRPLQSPPLGRVSAKIPVPHTIMTFIAFLVNPIELVHGWGSLSQFDKYSCLYRAWPSAFFRNGPQ
ncbi:hypothetical protein [Azospirillum largimobile]